MAMCASPSPELSRLVKQRVSASLRARDLDLTIVPLDLGYGLRCAPPCGFDIQYCRSLGYWATRFLLEGGSGAMVTIQEGRFVPIPFPDLLDPSTGKIRVRYVDMLSDAYRTLAAYMIRLNAHDFEDAEQVRALARAGNLTEQAFGERFGHLVGKAA